MLSKNIEIIRFGIAKAIMVVKGSQRIHSCNDTGLQVSSGGGGGGGGGGRRSGDFRFCSFSETAGRD